MSIDEKTIVGESQDKRPIYAARNIDGMSRFLSFKVDISYVCGNCNAHNEKKKVEPQNRYIFGCTECGALNQLDMDWKEYSADS